jgi:hypothetical protein
MFRSLSSVMASLLVFAFLPELCIASSIDGTHLFIPLDNKTALNTDIVTSWVSSPDRRGTGDILYSCTITIVLCIFTVLHMNVPGHGERPWKQYRRKIKWMFIALIAPEVVLYVAYTQYQEARSLCKTLNDLKPGDSESDRDQTVTTQTRHRWFKRSKSVSKPTFELAYGFFVVMGGFVVDVSRFCDFADRLTLDANTVARMARCNRFLETRQADIEDRSKANILGKGLACLQITWMLIQCAARRASGYPLTLLEIHTFVHVTCAVPLYFFWLRVSKPPGTHFWFPRLSADPDASETFGCHRTGAYRSATG